MRNYEQIEAFFDDFVDREDAHLARTDGYHRLIRNLAKAMVPPGSRVLEIGSGRGDLLAALEPSYGVGVDVSERMVAAARERHPALRFEHAAGEDLDLGETFDYVVLSDLVPYVYDLQALLAAVRRHCTPRTRVIASSYSLAWRPLLRLLVRAGIRARRPVRNWVAPRDLENLFELAGLEVVTRRTEILVPTRSRLLSKLANGVLARLPGVSALCLTYWLVGRPAPERVEDLGVSVIVPCRNEEGNVPQVLERVPDMGRATEIVFVEGHSTDGTRAAIEAEVERSERDVALVVQTGKGKANATWEGFAAAKHEVLMILDGDLSVAPEDLPKFYEGLVSGRGELINGARLVYGMEPGAMRFLNLFANKAFAWLLSFVLGQYVRDTLCGTKVLLREDYDRLRAQRPDYREDPYGDFDLLLGSALGGRKILNLPVRYAARTYGEPNIDRFNEGPILLRLAVDGYRALWVRAVER